jgi:CBS domain-containing protein
MTNMLLKNFMDSCTVASILQTGSAAYIPVAIHEDSTVEEALKMLSDNHILSMPVYRHLANPEYYAVIDMLTIMRYILEVYTEEHIIENHGKLYHWSSWCTDITTLTKNGKEFCSCPVRTLLDRYDSSKFCPVPPTGNGVQILEVLSTGVHRCPVIDEKKSLAGILSQSTVNEYIARNISCLGEHLANRPVAEFGLTDRGNVVSITPDAFAIHAVHLMTTHNVSAVAVVQDHQLIGTVSSTDLEGISQTHLGLLLCPVVDFLKRQQELLGQKPASVSLPPLTITPQTTIETAILKMAVTKVHRLWVVNEHGAPVDVVSLTDLLRVLLENVQG